MKEVNIYNLDSSTEQEVFDYIAKHLLKQNKKSKTGDGCAYWGHRGLKCAAGCLIPDDFSLSPRTNNIVWESFTDDNNITKAHTKLIRYLQIVHDDSEPFDWKNNLRQVATQFRLSTAIIES